MAVRKHSKRAGRKLREILSAESGIADTSHAKEVIKSRYSFALRKLPLSNGTSNGAIVDVGIGKGTGVKETGSEKRFVGMDYNPHGLKIVTEEIPKLKGRVVQANAAAIPFKNVEAITAFEILEHLSAKDKEKFLEGAKNALKRGGTLILSTPLSFGPIKTLNRYHWRKELTLPQLKELMGKYFEDVEYYGLGEMPKTLVKKLGTRAQELLGWVDFMGIRKKIVPREVRSKILHKLRGKTEIKSLREYFKEGTLPANIIAVARKRR